MEKSKTFQSVVNKRNFYTTKDSAWVFLWALITPIVISFAFSYLGMFISKATGLPYPGDVVLQADAEKYVWFTIPYMILSQLSFFAVFFVYNKVNSIKFKSVGFSYKKIEVPTCFISILMGVFGVLGFFLLIEGCFTHLFQKLNFHSSSMPIPMDGWGWYFLYLLLLGVLPAICEELVFRGVIMNGLRQKFRGFGLILLSSLCFSLMHQNIYQLVFTFILGCLLGFVYEKTNNILYPIIIHMFNNFTTITLNFLLTYLGNTGRFDIAGFPQNYITWWFVILAIFMAGLVSFVLLIFCVFYFRKHPKLEMKKEGEEPKPTLSLGTLPVVMLICFVVCIISIVINAAL